MWITWGTDTAQRPAVPVRVPARPAPPGHHRPPRHLPGDRPGSAGPGYDRARILLARFADGLRLHQLRHSSATHLGEANVSASVIMAKTGRKSLRSVQRYVKPGLAAVHAATETLSSPRRRG
jgi:integrase